MDCGLTLIVFSDDWGRHPSSCQHLTAQLLPRYRTLWVNTVGTRSPRLSWEDVGKAAVKLWQWMRPARTAVPASVSVPPGDNGRDPLDNLTVITPRMYPGFRKPWQRLLNAKLVASAVNKTLGPRKTNDKGETERRVVVTTIPVTADLVGKIDADRWVYYCPDDFSVWPGLDGAIMEDMDRQLAQRVDEILVVSETLQQRMKSFGREATLLTHGIDLPHWTSDPPRLREGLGEGEKPRRSRGDSESNADARPESEELTDTQSASPSPGRVAPDVATRPPSPSEGEGSHSDPPPLREGSGEGEKPPHSLNDAENRTDAALKSEQSQNANRKSQILADLAPPILLFWGVVDQRLDTAWCLRLANECGTLVLLGPQQSPDPKLINAANVVMPGPAPYESLPALAAEADVLVMPYADLPVTRAIQPLKFKEYLATGRPVVSRKLPATAAWADAADVLDDLDQAVRITNQRIADGTPPSQREARQRLADEAWPAKAAVLERAIRGESEANATRDHAWPSV